MRACTLSTAAARLGLGEASDGGSEGMLTASKIGTVLRQLISAADSATLEAIKRANAAQGLPFLIRLMPRFDLLVAGREIAQVIRGEYLVAGFRIPRWF